VRSSRIRFEMHRSYCLRLGKIRTLTSFQFNFADPKQAV
jgi:hypothetical protein